MTLDREAISSGYVVFARPDDERDGSGVGPFVGVVDDLLTIAGRDYVHVRGGLENATELFVPLAEVRVFGRHQVHLQLAVEDLSDQAWHLPLSGAALEPVGYWG